MTATADAGAAAVTTPGGPTTADAEWSGVARLGDPATGDAEAPPAATPAATGRLDAEYLLPLRRTAAGPPPAEFTAYLAWLTGLVDVTVVDGSPPPVFAAHRAAWAGLGLRHVAPDPAVTVRNGKVAGVLTGLRRAGRDRVVVADDDVRYDATALRRVVGLLDSAQLVRPQNYFAPQPWHARWDTARTLLNRAFGADYPGTLAVHRSALAGAGGGYDGDVLFENLELIRTVEALGGRVVTPLDCFVRRVPPTAGHFGGQRVRQAYDDLAQPGRLALMLSLLPLVATLTARRQTRALAAVAAGSVALAEAGRRRAGGRAVFPASASWFAPLWLAERAVCSWLAVGWRVVRGGCPYAGSVLRRAASSPAELRRRYGTTASAG